MAQTDDGDTTLRLHLSELHRAIKRLTDATFAAYNRGLRVLLAGLEHEARLCKQEIERQLGARD